VPLILRKIRRSKWYKSEGVPWLPEGELQADALVDLATAENKLSVYLVNDDQSNLEQVVTALAANADYISNFDYALLNQETIINIGIRIENTPGQTPDSTVNTWHMDLSGLTVKNVIALANAVWAQTERRRIPSRRIQELVVNGVSSQQLDQTKLKPKLAERLRGIINEQERLQ
jgi:hypothetical protein